MPKIIKIKKYQCSYCKEKYHYKKDYNKHIIMCNKLNQTSSKITFDENELSQKQMVYIIKELMFKCDKLENEVNNLKKYVDKTKKRINVLDYLNNDYKCKNMISFKNFITEFNINREDLLYMFQNNYINGIVKGLLNNLPLEKTYEHCIKCFDQKCNIFFKYDINKELKEETNNRNEITYKWSIFDENDFNVMIMKISQKFMKEYSEWKKENIEKIEKDEQFQEQALQYMKIVLGGNHEKDYNLRNIKKHLYQYLKCDLKNIVKYEFTF